MPRSYDANSNRRINQPKVAQGPPVPNTGAGVGMKQPSTISPVQPRARRDEIQRPMAQPGAKPTAAPSHTQPAAQGPPTGGVQPPAPIAGAVETGRQYQGEGGEKISVKPSPEQMQAQAVGGGAQPVDSQGAVAPPMQPSPLGPESPIEKHANTGAMGLGQNAHIRSVTMGKMGGMSRAQQIDHERKAVRDFQAFGAYEGADDPNSPPPPIRVGKTSYNPESDHWVLPEGHVSPLDRARQ